MKQQTAVEWLVEFIQDHLIIIDKKIIDKAKQMEKEQIINAHNQSWHDKMNPYKTADRYYQETFTNDK